MLGNLGKGALAGGALVALLGTGAGRKLTGTAAALGGIGMLGKVAFDAFKTWQSDQGDAARTPARRCRTCQTPRRRAAARRCSRP
jgi:uncharacterized membrane protein YebE (DUF533 family)